ncbi:MAG TPA: serine/threonine-protein kinase [Thiohalobacter sp.]|nr:serine/threonine-protein kinase [Thiohalobacter sp.]
MLKKSPQALAAGTRLDRYHIVKTLGGGGFSLVYLARDTDSGTQVIIKEYIPSKLACRTRDGQVAPRSQAEADRFNRGRMLFLQEAGALARLKHPNIVNVFTFFSANGTVYMVMDYHDGRNLQTYLTRRRGRLSERFLRTVFPPLLDGLEVIHQQDLLHLDIKPGNIHIRPGGHPLLLDFGAVHGFPQSRQTQPGQVISPGFSPIEQYESNGYVGPWTDIYSLGASMRACIEGRPPLSAPERRERDTLKSAASSFRRDYSAPLLELIDWCMEVDPELRPQNVAQLRPAFYAESEAPAAGGEPESTFDRLVGSLPWAKG